MLLNKIEQNILEIERACNDLRKGFPIIISNGNEETLVTSPETTTPKILSNINNYSLVLTKNRAAFLTSNKETKEIKIPLPKNIESLVGLSDKKTDLNVSDIQKVNELDLAALQIAKISELMPAAIVAKSLPGNKFTKINIDQINLYSTNVSYEINESCRTSLVIKGTDHSEIIAFRPNIGGKEHYAIIIGKDIPKSPLIRIHSSCYTGDLLNSLECDCNSQLREAIKIMNNLGGGIILYMLQEGRGIGLINKLRAYSLKHKGMDTVDANESLGFEDDERAFAPAAQILKKLNISSVDLLTNNPRKSKGLEDCGIKVNKCVPHIMEHNEHNKHYLHTKFTRLGHKKDNK